MKQFEFIGKKRTFKRVKMAELMDMQSNMQEAINTFDNNKDKLIAMGKIVEKFLTPFDPEEMLDAEPEDFYLAQGLHLIATYYKHNKSKKEIDEVKQRIIDSAIELQFKAMENGGQIPFQ